MPFIKTVLADDHPNSLEIIEMFVQSHPRFEIVGKCTNGEELIDLVISTKPDLVITDIKMPRLNGMEAIKKCRQFDENIHFIFVTGYHDYAVEAFNVAAIDYIVKPFSKPRFYAALEKAANMITNNWMKKLMLGNKKLKIKSQSSLYFIPLEDIYFIEKQGKKCLIYGKDKTYETTESINELYKKLNHTFFLSHRSNIINLRKLSHITSNNETYLAHFEGINIHAHISKLKIKEIKEIIQHIF